MMSKRTGNFIASKSDILSKKKEFLININNLSNVKDILTTLCDKSVKGKIGIACILALESMLTHALSKKKKPNQKCDGQLDAEEEYQKQLLQQYEAVLKCLLIRISRSKFALPLREQALVTYMKLISAESKHILKPSDISETCLPRNKFSALIKAIVGGKDHRENRDLLTRFQEYSALHDVALQIWTSVSRLLAAKTEVPHSEIFMRSVITLLEQTPIPNSELRRKEPDQLLFPKRGGNWPMKSIDKTLKKLVDQVWDHIRRWSHTEATLQCTILLILEKLMSHLSKPIMLTDFFMTALESGGAVSVLALQGIFKLIQQYNIEYPNIYGKLYSLFIPELFTMKYKSRLFFLADIFLSSTHLPEALVASFAKRLAKLALSAPVPDILIILPFIGNLLLRHKGLQILVNHPIGDLVSEDPFLDKELDPMKTRAMESSLWEIKSLQMHDAPPVAIAAKFINEKLPGVEWDLSVVLDGTYKQTFQKEMNKKVKQVSMTFIRPDPEKVVQVWPFHVESSAITAVTS